MPNMYRFLVHDKIQQKHDSKGTDNIQNNADFWHIRRDKILYI